MRTARLRQGFVSAVILIIALNGFGMVRYPLIVSEAGLSSVFLPAFMLLLYGVAAVWFTHRPGQAHVAALRTGTAYGLVVGVTFIVTISVENFVDIIGKASTISTLGSCSSSSSSLL